jgi:glycosyltransferase involved in cell wall biosynthesis
MDLSVCIITLNEEDRIHRLLKTMPKDVEFICVDSNSQDKTTAMVEEFGGKVIQRDFDHFAGQKNFALKQATKTWILSLDADEVVTSEAWQAIRAIVEASHNQNFFYRLKRRQIFCGKLLRFGKSTDHPVRLFKRENSKFEGTIHEHIVVDGPIKMIPGVVWHYSYRDFDDYFKKFNRYTSMMAGRQMAKERNVFLPLVGLRGAWEFFQRYVLRLGFLDGGPGFIFCLLGSFYVMSKFFKTAYPPEAWVQSNILNGSQK